MAPAFFLAMEAAPRMPMPKVDSAIVAKLAANLLPRGSHLPQKTDRQSSVAYTIVAQFKRIVEAQISLVVLLPPQTPRNTLRAIGTCLQRWFKRKE